MPGRSRRFAIGFLFVAAALALGQWAASFFAERLWESGISAAAAAAGARRALIGTGLEVALILVTAGWLLLHFSFAARTALPWEAPPGEAGTRTWPRTLPAWSVPVAAIVTGVLLGSGGARLVDPFRIMLDGARLGIREPFLQEDLATFLGSFPFWSALQKRAAWLSLVALGVVILLYLAGGHIRRVGRRIRVSPKARGQLAILIAILALTLAWGASLEPLRLAGGLRGPVRHAEFDLQALMAWLQTGVGAAAAVVSLLAWIRLRGAVALLLWAMFGLAWIGRGLLPLHPDQARTDPIWGREARRIDAFAFQLPAGAGEPPWFPAVGAITPSLWDDSVAVRAGLGSSPHRGWLRHPGPLQRPDRVPVWLGLRLDGELPLLVALADDRVAGSGAPLFWESRRPEPETGATPYRALARASLLVRPDAPRISLERDSLRTGIAASSLPRRFLLAWAWQFPRLLAASSATRVNWKLDPLVRLQSLAPYVHWTTPRLRMLESEMVWQSDGLLVTDRFPGSVKVPWGTGGGSAAMVRSTLMGVVDAASGGVRLFRRDDRDSLAAMWARLSRPLIEPVSAIPPELRAGEPYPGEFALAQARVLAGPAWNAGTLELERSTAVTVESPGGSERVISFLGPGSQVVAALLLLRRTPTGDSLRLIGIDSFPPLESAALLRQRWDRFPFQQMLRDSVLAAGAQFRVGTVRYALSTDGPVAYEPAWALGPAARPRLALVNVAWGARLGTGRTFQDAWRNLRGEISPVPVGAASQEILDEVRRWWQSADSAFKRGDLEALGRALTRLRDLLERQP